MTKWQGLNSMLLMFALGAMLNPPNYLIELMMFIAAVSMLIEAKYYKSAAIGGVIVLASFIALEAIK
jgi:hypothetical protein